MTEPLLDLRLKLFRQNLEAHLNHEDVNFSKEKYDEFCDWVCNEFALVYRSGYIEGEKSTPVRCSPYDPETGRDLSDKRRMHKGGLCQ